MARKAIAQFRIKVVNADWADTQIIDEVLLPTDDDNENANGHARHIAHIVNREVRWNWEGSLQGHYVSPLVMAD